MISARGLMVLRVAFATCFIGHGAFGILQKPEWLPFFHPFLMGDALALRLMPVIGAVDIAIGVLGLMLPLRVVWLYGAIWAVFTAALRPMTAQSVAEFFERAGNYGVPLALLALTAGMSWTTVIRRVPDSSGAVRAAGRICLWSTALLLAGHGWLALTGKPLLAQHLGILGLEGSLRAFGATELCLALLCLVRPSAGLLIFVMFWKISTESLFIAAGAPIWEFIERGGSYAAPLAAAMLLERPATARANAAAVAASMALLIGAAAPAGAQELPSTLTPSLLAELRTGGLVLACRHAITSHEREDRMPVDLADPSTQRLLSPEGEAQAAALGKAITALGIRFGEVVASPFDRTRKSAELTAGRVEVDDALAMTTRGKEAELRALMTGPVPSGANRVVVTHQGLLYRSLPTVRRGSVAEGDCLVVRPSPSAPEVLGHLKPAAWKLPEPPQGAVPPLDLDSLGYYPRLSR